MLHRPVLETPREQHLPPEGDLLAGRAEPVSEHERAEESRRLVQTAIDALRAGLVTAEDQHRLFEQFDEVVQQKEVIAVAGLKSATVFMIQRQAELVNEIVHESFNTADDSEYSTSSSKRLPAKDVANLMHKTVTLMASKLPQIINLARITAIEQAHTEVIEEFLPREAQDAYFKKLNTRLKAAESGRT